MNPFTPPLGSQKTPYFNPSSSSLPKNKEEQKVGKIALTSLKEQLKNLENEFQHALKIKDEEKKIEQLDFLDRKSDKLNKLMKLELEKERENKIDERFKDSCKQLTFIDNKLFNGKGVEVQIKNFFTTSNPLLCLSVNEAPSEKRSTYENLSSYTEHAKLIMFKFLRKKPEFNEMDYLPGIAAVALLLAVKYGEDERVMTEDLQMTIQDITNKYIFLEFILNIENYIFDTLDHNLYVASEEEMDKEIQLLKQQLQLLPEKLPERYS